MHSAGLKSTNNPLPPLTHQHSPPTPPPFLLCLSSQRLCVTAPGCAELLVVCLVEKKRRRAPVRCSHAQPRRRDDGFHFLQPNRGCFSRLARLLSICVLSQRARLPAKEIGFCHDLQHVHLQELKQLRPAEASHVVLEAVSCRVMLLLLHRELLNTQDQCDDMGCLFDFLPQKMLLSYCL